jgi:hypothetical protein
VLPGAQVAGMVSSELAAESIVVFDEVSFPPPLTLFDEVSFVACDRARYRRPLLTPLTDAPY